MKKKLEICCPTIQAATIAEECGADRIEFCTNLEVGGTTASFNDIIKLKSLIKIPIHVLIRCRAGNFFYTDDEIKKMIDEIKFCASIGIKGVVIGALKNNNTIDFSAIEKMLPVANLLEITFHKAFDEIENQTTALQQLIDFNFTRVLTSGGKSTAIEGAEQLKKLNEISKKKITIMPGGGIRSVNLESIMNTTQCNAFHSAASISQGIEIFKNEIMKMKSILEIL